MWTCYRVQFVPKFEPSYISCWHENRNLFDFGFRGHGQRWYFVCENFWARYKLVLWFCFHTSIVNDRRSSPVGFGSPGQRSRSTLDHISETVWTLILVFSNHFQSSYLSCWWWAGEPILILGRGVKGQG